MKVRKKFRCYHCRKKVSLATIRRVDDWFDEVSSDEYNCLIDELGLHGCVGSNMLFHHGLANICLACFRSARELYREFMMEDHSNQISSLGT